MKTTELQMIQVDAFYKSNLCARGLISHFWSHLTQRAKLFMGQFVATPRWVAVVSFLLIHYSICVAVLFSFIKGETSNSRPAKEFENRYFSRNCAWTQFECRTILCLPGNSRSEISDNGIKHTYYVLYVFNCWIHKSNIFYAQ